MAGDHHWASSTEQERGSKKKNKKQNRVWEGCEVDAENEEGMVGGEGRVGPMAVPLAEYGEGQEVPQAKTSKGAEDG